MAKIDLVLYDENDEPVRTLSRSGVPWLLMKKAVKMQDELKEMDHMGTMDAVAGLVAELYANQATRDEIEAGANAEEIMTAYRAIITANVDGMRRNFQTAPAKVSAEQ